MKSVKELNHYVNREEQKTRKQSNITDFFCNIFSVGYYGVAFKPLYPVYPPQH